MWTLRRASAEDAGAASLIAGATFLEAFAGVLTGPDIVAHVAAKSSPAVMAEWIAHPQAVLTLAEHPDGGAQVGYTLLTPPDLPIELSEQDLELRRIYTLSLARSSGLGAKLIDRAITDALALGATRLLLGVLDTNMRARTFYERQGFTIAGERRFLVGKTWHDDVIYALTLQPS